MKPTEAWSTWKRCGGSPSWWRAVAWTYLSPLPAPPGRAAVSGSPRLRRSVSSSCIRVGLSGRVASNVSPFRRAVSASG